MNNQTNPLRKGRILPNSFFSTVFLFFASTVFSAALAQSLVTGIITDQEGTPLPGVSVVVEGTSNGVSTDFDGNYSINVEVPDATLVYSYIGFLTQKVPRDDQDAINIQMAEDVQNLEEVVVVGYGTQKKETLSGSVASVDGEELTKSPAVNLSNTLSGRVPGLFVQQPSAEPGYDGANIRIRGTNTYNNSGALVVVDGIPDRDGGLARINPADIESISVLKDASAAIYGARAANGVILITTKRGKPGKPQFTLTSNQGWAQPTVIPELANAPEYAELRNELEIYNLPVNEWQAATTGFNATGTYTRPDGSIRNAIYTPEDIELFSNGNDQWGHPDTDWFDETFKTAASQEKHTLQLTGGGENFSYFTSMGYTKQDAYYKKAATGYEQYDLRINLDANITDNVKLSLGVLGREEFRFFPTESAGAIFRMLTRGRPTEPAYWPNGFPGPDIENGQQPVVITTNATGYDRDKRDFFQSNATLDIKIPWVKGLSFKANAAIDKSFLNRKVWSTPWTLYTWDGENRNESGLTPVQRGPADPRLFQATNNTLNILLGATMQYEREFGEHSLLVLAGTNKETTEFETFNAFRRFFISSSIDELFAGGDDQKDNDGFSDRSSRLNYFGRLTYDFQDKYLFEFLWRYDGSYLFPEETRYGFFPGFSAGWIVTKENFLGDVNNDSFLNFLKFRGSWGQLGNDKFNNADFPQNQFLATYGFGNYVINNVLTNTLSESRVPNPNITWEIATNIDIGLDARFLQNRMSLTFDVFLNKRSDILTQPSASLPQLSGITPPRINIGEVENKGFDFILGYNGQVGEDFTYGISLNGGFAKNKIIFSDEAEGSPEWQRTTGRPIRSNLVYGYEGIFATQADIDAETLDYSALVNELRPGDMKLLDFDGDGAITPDDRFRTDKNSDPTFQYGANLTASYKNFDLSLLFQGATGGELFLSFGEAGTIGNYPATIYDNRWTVDNPSNVDPRITNRADQYYSNGNTYWRQDTDYVRVKNLEIGYNFPEEIVGPLGLSRFRMYLSGSNLFTITNSLFDPESLSGQGRDYPVSRIINGGFSLTF